MKPDNLYDLLFDHSGAIKANTEKKAIFTGESLDFLENNGNNIKIVETGKKAVELDKLKISK